MRALPVELQHLRTFVAVAAAGSVTRAAEQLYLTPPSVSAQIRALEDELGVTLFVRAPGGMQLTAAGARLRLSAEHTLAAAEELQREAAQLRARPSGQMSLGLNATAEFLRVAPLLGELRTAYPDIGVTCVVSMTTRIIAELRAGNLDLGFVFGDISDGALEVYPLGTAELVVALPAAWMKTVRVDGWADLAELPWIGSALHCPFQELLKGIFARYDLVFRRAAHTCDEEATRRDLVRAGVGLSLMERGEAERAARDGDLAIWAGETVACPLSLAVLAARAGEPAIKAVRATIEEIWRSRENTAQTTKRELVGVTGA